MKIKNIIFSGMLLLTLKAFAEEELFEPGLPKFYKVDDGVYRSARPTDEGLQIAKNKYGIVAIIDLENDEKVVAHESSVAKALGLDFLWSEMAWYETPIDTEVDRVLSRMSSKSSGAVLVHCHEGKDRTGLIAALYRVLVQNWQPEKAYKEWVDLGFNKWIFKFKNYFKARTQERRADG